jgi:hypothetical protein
MQIKRFSNDICCTLEWKSFLVGEKNENEENLVSRESAGEKNGMICDGEQQR